MKARSSGFTLTEVLVVSGIIALLAAILLTVISRIKEQGRQTVCQNQLQQLALATQQYAQDSDGHYPGDRFQTQLFPYIKSTALLECPTHAAYSSAFPGTPDSHFYVWGYNYNGIQLADKTKANSSISFKGRHEASVLDASTTWVFGDDHVFSSSNSGGGGFVAYSQCGTSASFWDTLHNGGANYAFLDGHIKWLTPASIDRIACSTGSTS